MTLGYRGTRYAGWSRTPGQATIQATLETVLASVVGHPVRATAAGRTDAGVHADGQVVSFETSSPIPCDGLRRVVQQQLPDDIWVVGVDEVAPEFDARRSAVRRWYRYAIWRAGVPTAAWQGRCLEAPQALGAESMRAGARALLGRDDFASLVTRPSAERSTLRTVFAADWLEVSVSLLLFEICADAFLKQMVRAIVGSLMW